MMLTVRGPQSNGTLEGVGKIRSVLKELMCGERVAVKYALEEAQLKIYAQLSREERRRRVPTDVDLAHW